MGDIFQCLVSEILHCLDETACGEHIVLIQLLASSLEMLRSVFADENVQFGHDYLLVNDLDKPFAYLLNTSVHYI